MPRAPALFGGAVGNTPHGFQFQGGLPSAVGPVIGGLARAQRAT